MEGNGATLMKVVASVPVIVSLIHSGTYSSCRGSSSVSKSGSLAGSLAFYSSCVCAAASLAFFLSGRVAIAKWTSREPASFFETMMVCSVVLAATKLALFPLATSIKRKLGMKVCASDPGGPVRCRSLSPQSLKGTTYSLDFTRYRFVDPTVSHEYSAKALKPYSHGTLELSGERCGRGCWSCSRGRVRSSVLSPLSIGDTTTVPLTSPYVAKLCLGGEDTDTVGFDKHSNVNSRDKVFRIQRIKEFMDAGGDEYDISVPSGMLHLLQGSTNTPSIGRCNGLGEAKFKGMAFYRMLQGADGSFNGDYGGPLFLMPGLVVVWYITRETMIREGNWKGDMFLNEGMREGAIVYFRNHQQGDGGWGTHIEGPSTMFGTVMCYVAMRLMGVDAQDECMISGRDFISRNGSATHTSSWCKFYLCLVGLMPWSCHNSTPIEMFLLPRWFPFHPGRMWCHARMVYMPMAYLYCKRFVYRYAEEDETILEIRSEIYNEAYDSINWPKLRSAVAEMDNYSPVGFLMRSVQSVLAWYETSQVFSWLREASRNAAYGFAEEYLHAEDVQTNYICIGPVNKVLNMLIAFIMNGSGAGPTFVQHCARVDDYLWVAEDGVKMQGYNGSQCWDTSFAVQAVAECDLLDNFPSFSLKAYNFLERTQILSTETSRASGAFKYEGKDFRERFFRHVSLGGWPFSTSAHGWPISDCTGEGLKAVLQLHQTETIKEGMRLGKIRNVISEKRLRNAVNVILELQNEDGGFATYENNRGFGWYEWLNPSEGERPTVRVALTSRSICRG